MAKFKVEFRGEKAEQIIEADGFQRTADSKHYEFFKGKVELGKPNTVAMIPAGLVASVKKIED